MKVKRVKGGKDGRLQEEALTKTAQLTFGRGQKKSLKHDIEGSAIKII